MYNPFSQRKEVFMLEVENEERNYGDHPRSMFLGL